MHLIIDDFLSYDVCALWSIHDAYYAAQGLEAWRSDIPSIATSNRIAARQHARMLLGLVEQAQRAGSLKNRDPILVLEVGCGSGAFADNFLKALQHDLGPRGQRLLRRMRYILTDYSRKNVEEALSQGDLQKHADDGNLIPAIFDIDRPNELTDLDGIGLALERPVFCAIANYVVCVTRSKQIRKVSEDAWQELHVRLVAQCDDPWLFKTMPRDELLELCRNAATSPDFLSSFELDLQWKEVSLDDVFNDPFHSAILRDTLSSLPQATVIYPHAFFQWIQHLQQSRDPVPHIIIADYGFSLQRHLAGLKRPYLHAYGNALSHAVHFPLFDTLPNHTDIASLRTTDPLAPVHRVLLTPQDDLPQTPLQELLLDCYGTHSPDQNYLDFRSAARALEEIGDTHTSARFHQRLNSLEPSVLQHRIDLARTAVEASFAGVALDALSTLPDDAPEKERFQHAFQRGRALRALSRYEEALKAFEEAFDHSNDPDALLEKARTYSLLHDWGRVRIELQRAQGFVESDDPRVDEEIQRMKDRMWSALPSVSPKEDIV